MHSVRLQTLLSAAAVVVFGIADDAASHALAARTPTALTSPKPSVTELRPSYQIRLESAWPIPPGETDACNNRASETLDGTLRRVGTNRYEGRFTRQTSLGFCGRHGPAVEACSAVLRGVGDVAVVGEITYGADGTPSMSVVWQPVPATTHVSVEGSCSPRFAEALEGMYRTAVHSVDFRVPDRARRSVALEDYGRTLDIS